MANIRSRTAREGYDCRDLFVDCISQKLGCFVDCKSQYTIIFVDCKSQNPLQRYKKNRHMQIKTEKLPGGSDFIRQRPP
jgi:hypothetical protein